MGPGWSCKQAPWVCVCAWVREGKRERGGFEIFGLTSQRDGWLLRRQMVTATPYHGIPLSGYEMRDGRVGSVQLGKSCPHRP